MTKKAKLYLGVFLLALVAVVAVPRVWASQELECSGSQQVGEGWSEQRDVALAIAHWNLVTACVQQDSDPFTAWGCCQYQFNSTSDWTFGEQYYSMSVGIPRITVYR